MTDIVEGCLMSGTRSPMLILKSNLDLMNRVRFVEKSSRSAAALGVPGFVTIGAMILLIFSRAD